MWRWLNDRWSHPGTSSQHPGITSGFEVARTGSSSRRPIRPTSCCSTSCAEVNQTFGRRTHEGRCDMKTDNAQIVLGAALIGAFASFWRWHSPPAKKLTPEEIDHYLELISKLPLPGDEID